MIKQVFELTPADIEHEAIWVFPMDESAEDELSVRPVRNGEIVPDGLQRIVRAVFQDRSGRVLPGYIYPSCGNGVEETRPVAWCDSLCITFWNGMIEPSRAYLDKIRLAALQWPLTYRTDACGVEPQQGTLDGLYYRDGKVRCLRPHPG